MKNKFCVIFLLIAIITVMVLGIVVFLSLRSSVRFPELGIMRIFDFFGPENDLCLASTPGANAGLIMIPYQSGNPDRELAVIIGASVSYVLSEVKYFTLFIVVMTVLAVNAFSIIIYFVLDKIGKPIVSREKAALALEIDEMLAEIDSLMEKSKMNQMVLVK